MKKGGRRKNEAWGRREERNEGREGTGKGKKAFFFEIFLCLSAQKLKNLRFP